MLGVMHVFLMLSDAVRLSGSHGIKKELFDIVCESSFKSCSRGMTISGVRGEG